jgi:hypothetical protein
MLDLDMVSADPVAEPLRIRPAFLEDSSHEPEGLED